MKGYSSKDIIKILLETKKVKLFFVWLIKLVWSIIAFYLIYLFYTTFVGPVTDIPDWLKTSFIYFIGVFAIVICILFDRCISIIMFLWNKYLSRVIK